MYLFTRQARLAPGRTREAVAWAIGITEKVNQITSLDLGLWTPVLSPGLGTMSFGTAVESLGDLEDADAKLSVDNLFQDAVEGGAHFLAGNVEDETGQFVHNPAAPDNTSHVAVVRAQLANGSLRRGIEVGVEIAQRASTIGGAPTAFLLSTTGSYGGCAWITSATSMRELETAEQAVNGDASFLTYLDEEAAGCFVEGATTQGIWRRVV
jgi:hypothetical protein